jgi:hypothetical protein
MPKFTFSTSGRLSVYFDTINATHSFETGGVAAAYMETISESALFETSGKALAAFETIKNVATFQSASTIRTPFETFGDNVTKELLLRIGQITISNDCSTITVTDDTGVFEAGVNNGGYTPEDGTGTLLRPKRSEVDLYVLTQNMTTPNAPLVYHFISDPTAVPFVGEAIISESGIYRVYMLAVPTGEDVGDEPSIQDFVNTTLGWFIVEAAIVVNCELGDCVATREWDYFEQLECGKCDKTFVEFYSNLMALYEALGTKDYNLANILYADLIKDCQDRGCGCKNC